MQDGKENSKPTLSFQHSCIICSRDFQNSSTDQQKCNDKRSPYTSYALLHYSLWNISVSFEYWNSQAM